MSTSYVNKPYMTNEHSARHTPTHSAHATFGRARCRRPQKLWRFWARPVCRRRARLECWGPRLLPPRCCRCRRCCNALLLQRRAWRLPLVGWLPLGGWCGRYRCDICFVCHRQRHRHRGRSDTLAHCRRICCRHSCCRHSCYRLLRRICSRPICSRRICGCHTLEAHRCRSSSTTRLLCLCA